MVRQQKQARKLPFYGILFPRLCAYVTQSMVNSNNELRKKLSIMPRSGDFACAIQAAIYLRQSNDFGRKQIARRELHCAFAP
jgi:hypothetical protein